MKEIACGDVEADWISTSWPLVGDHLNRNDKFPIEFIAYFFPYFILFNAFIAVF